MKRCMARGFTLIEMMIVVVIVAVLAAIALPAYTQHVVRAARVQAQAELLELAGLQEKIFLNSNSYSPSVTAAYNGTSSGGLGRTSGQTNDGRYTLGLDITSPAQTFVLTARPTAGGTQADDGDISISESGRRLWGSASW